MALTLNRVLLKGQRFMEITWDVRTRYCVARPALREEILNCVTGNKGTVRRHVLA